MRTIFLALLLPLAACGGAGGSNDTAQSPDNAAPPPSGPPPKTPVMQVTPAPGNEAEWMTPRPGAGDPTTAPYGNLLDQPLVDAPPAR